MNDEELLELEDVPEPTWKERLAAVKRAASALIGTRAAIFREEIAGKRAHLAKSAIGFALAASFGVLSLLVLTAFIAAVFTTWLGGPIAGLAATLFLYLLIAGATGFLGARSFARVRPFEFPITRDEMRKDLDAVSAGASGVEDVPASPDMLAAERATVPPEDPREDEEEVELEEREPENLEQRFRAGSE